MSLSFKTRLILSVGAISAFFLAQVIMKFVPSATYTGDMEKEFHEISAPNSTTVRNFINSNKGAFMVVSANFSVNEKCSDVLDSYDAQLLRKGWLLKNNKKEGMGKPLNTYCKKNLDASVEVSSSTTNSCDYYFGVTWREGPAFKTGC